jgi:hypothetical protein
MMVNYNYIYKIIWNKNTLLIPLIFFIFIYFIYSLLSILFTSKYIIL